MAYDTVEPFGHRAEDLRGAMIAAAIHNRLRGKDESGHQLEEFQLIKPTPVVEDEKTLWAKLKTILRPSTKG
jgi:hypothetical protein